MPGSGRPTAPIRNGARLRPTVAARGLLGHAVDCSIQRQAEGVPVIEKLPRHKSGEARRGLHRGPDPRARAGPSGRWSRSVIVRVWSFSNSLGGWEEELRPDLNQLVADRPGDDGDRTMPSRAASGCSARTARSRRRARSVGTRSCAVPARASAPRRALRTGPRNVRDASARRPWGRWSCTGRVDQRHEVVPRHS